MANLGMAHYATGGVYYFRLVRILDGYIWNNVAGAWQASVSVNDSKITITETPTTTGDYPLLLPAAMVGGGSCNLVIYGPGSAVVVEKREISIGSINGF